MDDRADAFAGAGPATSEQAEAPIVAIDEVSSPRNIFSTLFAASLAESGFAVVPLSWSMRRLRRCHIVIFHWPDEFFGRGAPRKALKKLVKMQVARAVFGVRFVWVTHDIKAHDHSGPLWLSIGFVRSLAGLIHLSRRVQTDVRRRYHPRRAIAELVTVHGRYPGQTAAAPWRPIDSERPAELVSFGQLRPYKNLERLVSVAAAVPSPDFRLRVTGLVIDPPLAGRLLAAASDVAHVEVLPSPTPLEEAALEGFVDGADAVVLAYSSITNSGSIMFALCRNRPVLAPRQGSMQEVQDIVGSEWVRLYDGDLTGDVLATFLGWLRTPRGGSPDLSAFDWSRVRSDLAGFLRQLG